MHTLITTSFTIFMRFMENNPKADTGIYVGKSGQLMYWIGK
jgi:hypothetical protein